MTLFVFGENGGGKTAAEWHGKAEIQTAKFPAAHNAGKAYNYAPGKTAP